MKGSLVDCASSTFSRDALGRVSEIEVLWFSWRGERPFSRGVTSASRPGLVCGEPTPDEVSGEFGD